MNIMPLEATLPLYFLFHPISYTTLAAMHTSEGGVTPIPFNEEF